MNGAHLLAKRLQETRLNVLRAGPKPTVHKLTVEALSSNDAAVKIDYLLACAAQRALHPGATPTSVWDTRFHFGCFEAKGAT